MRILLVEDDAAVREVVEEYLIAMGYSVETMSSGREALEHLRAYRRAYDVALVDWQLPGITGRDVVLDIVNRHPETAVLITTGQPSNRLMQQIAKKPQVAILQKPFALRELHRRLKQAVNTQQSVESWEDQRMRMPAW